MLIKLQKISNKKKLLKEDQFRENKKDQRAQIKN